MRNSQTYYYRILQSRRDVIKNTRTNVSESIMEGFIFFIRIKGLNFEYVFVGELGGQKEKSGVLTKLTAQ